MRGTPLVTLVVALASPAAVAAAPCGAGRLEDPVSLSFQDGLHGVPGSACLRTELALGGAGAIIYEPRNFYGNVRAAGVLDGRWAFAPDLEVFGKIELVRYQTVISSLSADLFGLGYTSAGAAWSFHSDDRARLTARAALTLPTALGAHRRSSPFLLDAGVAATHDLSAMFELHGWLGARGSVAAGVAPDPRAGIALDAGVSFRPVELFSAVLDLEGSAGYRAALDHAALGLALRVRPADEVTLELAAKAPIAGDERSLLAAFLGVAWSPVP